MLDLNGDGRVSWFEEQQAYAYYESIAEQTFLDAMVMPADLEFNPFGGRMTSTNCGVAGRPPCDARHPSVDSYNGNLTDPIYATAHGRVVQTGATTQALDGTGAAGGFGKYIIIEHEVYGKKFYSIYAHNGTVLVEVGDTVSGGTQIATMGQTGTNNIHLHFEVRQATNVDLGDPNPFVSQTYWPATVTELNANYVNIGPIFGYHNSYWNWASNHP
jgi:murein DD-endopeptidase MepM/ murein hydrolase activator NlpD